MIHTDCEFVILRAHLEDRALATYSEDDFERIAGVTGKNFADVQRHDNAPEAAAM